MVVCALKPLVNLVRLQIWEQNQNSENQCFGKAVPSRKHEVVGCRLLKDAISVDVILRQSEVMTAAFVGRMAPEDLWELFQRVVPPASERPQGGGARRRGNREVLAAIIFVATSGCTWNQLPPGFGLSGVTAFRRFTEWTEAKRLRRSIHPFSRRT